jgi:hypothetical protein
VAIELCERCDRREAVWTRFPHAPRAGQRLCAVCRDEVERRDASEADRRTAEMPVDYDAFRALMREAEAVGAAVALARMAEVLRHSVERYGRILPPDVAEFMERHSRSRPSA